MIRSIQLEPKKMALEIAKLALDKKAEKVVILNIKKLSAIADYLLICSAESERQVQAIADSIEDGLRKKGERPLGSEGVTQGRWALIDYVDVVVHIFLDSVRSFYDLEGLWSEAQVTEVKERSAARPPKPKQQKATPASPKPRAKAVKKPAVKKAPKKTSAAKAPEKAAVTKAKTAARKKKKSE